MASTFRIKLSGLRFYGRIGVFDQERTVGNDFECNVEVELPGDNFVPEDLSTSISYAEIFDEIKSVFKSEYLLLETVAQTIGERLRQRYPLIIRGKVSITKLAPPIPGITGECGVEFFFEKNC